MYNIVYLCNAKIKCKIQKLVITEISASPVTEWFSKKALNYFVNLEIFLAGTEVHIINVFWHMKYWLKAKL